MRMRRTFDWLATVVVVLLLPAIAWAQSLALHESAMWVAHQGEVTSVAFAPDGRTLASSGTDNLIKLWDPTTNREIAVLRGHAGLVWSVTWSPDGRSLVSGSEDKTVRIWDSMSQRVRTTLTTSSPVWSVAVSSDGLWLAAGCGDKTTRVWNFVMPGRPVSVPGEADLLGAVQFMRGGKLLVTAQLSRKVLLWDPFTTEKVSVLNGGASPLAVSADGRWLASGGENETIKLWALQTRSLIATLSGHTGLITSLSFSPDGQWLASSSWDRTIRVWDVATYQLATTVHESSPVWSVAFSPDGLVLVAGESHGMLKCWQVYSKQPAISSGRPPFPAIIQIVGQSFTEPSGNQALDASESGLLTLRLKNASPYKGDLRVKLTSLTPTEHLTFERDLSVGIMEGNTEKDVTIPIAADLDVATGERRLRVEVVESYYHNDPPPFQFVFNTLAFQPPDFHIVLRDLLDPRDPNFPANNNDGRMNVSEVVQLKVVVQNIGQGTADNVRTELHIPGEGQSVFYRRDIQGNTDHLFKLQTLAPGASGELTFYISTNPFFTQDSLRIEVAVTEQHGRYGRTKTLAIPINQPVKTEQLFAVQSVPSQSPQIAKLGGLVDVDQAPTGSKTKMADGLAIIIGIESYKYTFDAMYKARDAMVFYDYCRTVFGIPEQNIAFRLNDSATKAEFDYLFEPRASTNEGWLKKRVKPNVSDIVIYLGGHGFPALNTGRPYFIPCDVRPEQATNGVALETLYKTLAEFEPRSVTIFVESCFSGLSGYQARPQALAVNMNPVVWQMEAPVIDPRFAVFTASSGTQASYNRDDLKHGIFTYYVLKAFRGDADENHDGMVTVGELYTYLAREVPRKALETPTDKEQQPSLLPPPQVLGERLKRVLVRY